MTTLAVSATFVFKDATSVSFGSDDIIDFSGNDGSLDAKDYTLISGQASLTVVNLVSGGSRFSDYFATKSPLFAAVVVTINGATAFEGVCSDVQNITRDRVTIEIAGFETEILKKFPAEMVTDEAYPYSLPSDRGKMLPVVFGAAARVPFRGIDVGATSTLFKDISDVDDSLELCDGLQFPAGAGIIVVDSEIITYTTRSGNILYGLTRASGDTSAAVHSAGAVVEEKKDEYVYAIGHPAESVSDVYIGNQKIDPAQVDYTVYTGQSGDEHASYPGKCVIVFDDPMIGPGGVMGGMPGLQSVPIKIIKWGADEIGENAIGEYQVVLPWYIADYITSVTLKIKASHGSGSFLMYALLDGSIATGAASLTGTPTEFELDYALSAGTYVFTLGIDNSESPVYHLFVDWMELWIEYDNAGAVSSLAGPDYATGAAGGPEEIAFRTTFFADMVGYDVSAPDDVMAQMMSLCGFTGTSAYDAAYGTSYALGFAVLSPPAEIGLIHEIARQALAITFFRDDVHYMVYAGATPTTDHTVLRAEVDAHTAAISYTGKNSLINRLSCPYNRRWWNGNQTDRTPDQSAVKADNSASVTAYGIMAEDIELPAVVLEQQAQDVADWIVRDNADTRQIVMFSGEHAIRTGMVIEFDTNSDLQAEFAGLLIADAQYRVIDSAIELNGTRTVTAVQIIPPQA